ncbi:invasion associated locus B family protein [Lutimaribacter sp. EGI FJ00015]|uniref:Invasion associated locus B family protein n=1 Tax=Lutimaribacter degradans TaxID=2945989 RepID=A0ACC5ZTA9_9RHOB|nr:invasion associated locus B family protein [Lutimaribacter sp. EGI FJ00013]MCM2561065.1 invasion associated locus B family protein [Lutimaribacter sp. EGI FJ00013]MCO0611987.1 invasion associated locus B family protein [Lutimaribacter sp. EGI FJ00015]MCO0634893.1 invasion associated locus B family protein [Lutimaribacter sp. EGI FJ00014]
MPKFISTLSVLALLAMPLAAQAQDTDDAGDETAPAMPQTQSDIGGAIAPQGSDLAMSEDMNDPEGPGTPYLREEVEDWALECIRVPEGEDEPCQLFQSLTDENDNLVSNVRIFKLPEGQRAAGGALVAVPLETLLTAQLTIKVDDGQAKRYPFAVCDPLGCYARIGFTAEEINAFKRGVKATVTIVPFVSPDTPINLDMSLKGFTAAYDKATVMPQ